MKMIDAQRTLQATGEYFLSSSDVAAILRVSQSYASKVMTRLETSGFALRLTRGRWAIGITTARGGRTNSLDGRGIDRFLVSEYLCSPSPSYISLYSALFYHEIISQIPETTYVVSISKTRLYRTKVGVISVHHMSSGLFFGFESLGEHHIKMASPEKALFDTLYLSPARSQIFHQLPETDFSKNFSFNRIIGMLKLVPSQSRRTIIRNRLNELSIKSGRGSLRVGI